MRRCLFGHSTLLLTRRFLLLGICALLCASLQAQPSGGGWHNETEYCLSGGRLNLNDSDFATFNFTLKPGWRFASGLFVACPLTLSVGEYNLASSKNFDNQGLAGIAAGYHLPLSGKTDFLEAEISCSSTVLNTEFNYLDFGIQFRYGVKAGNFKPFFGLGLSYLRQYDRTVPDKCLLGASIGLLL